MNLYKNLISEVSANDLLVDLLAQLKTICIIRFIINGLGVIASILMFIPVCSTNQENLQRSRRLVLPWAVWCFVKIISSAGSVVWFYAKLSHELHDISYSPTFAYAAIFDCGFYIWAAIIGISYYQWLNEDHVVAPFNQIVMIAPPHPQQNINIPYGQLPPYEKQ